MKIVVLAKEVPETGDKRSLSLESGLLERGQSERIIDEISERALENALKFRDDGGDAEITVLCMAPANPEASIRKLLAMGADSAVVIQDEALAGADATRTAGALAAAIARTGADLVIAGDASTDGRGGIVPSMVGELLGWPVLPGLDSLEISAGQVIGTTRNDIETISLAASMPAVTSITERSAEARFPNFKGIMKAKKKPMDTVSLNELGDVYSGQARSVMVSAIQRPERKAGILLHDDGSAIQKLVDFLSDQKLV